MHTHRSWLAGATVVLCLTSAGIVIGLAPRSMIVSASAAPVPPEGVDRRVRLRGVQTLADFANAVGAAYGLPVHIHQEQVSWLGAYGVEFGITESDVPTAFRLFNSIMPKGTGGGVDWRVFPDHVEIGVAHELDRPEMQRVTYNIASIVQSMGRLDMDSDDYRISRILDVLRATVRSEYWTDNGGDLATVQVVGLSLLVTAPKRMHPEIQRCLEDIAKAEESARLVRAWHKRW